MTILCLMLHVLLHRTRIGVHRKNLFANFQGDPEKLGWILGEHVGVFNQESNYLTLLMR
jgi:hypothetical protein